MTTRYDLYGVIHKALRGQLYGTAAEAARTEFADAREAAGLAARVRALLAELEGHSAHEDAAVMPRLARVAPEVHHGLEADHARLEGLHRELSALTGRLCAAATADERESLGARLRTALEALVSEHLRHMAVEEGAAQRALWAHFTDAELDAVHQEILESLRPEEVESFFHMALPAVSRRERATLLAALRSNAPPAAFDAITARGRAALGEALWEEALRQSAPLAA